MSTLHALLVLASEAAGEEETSKTPFYVAGGALALWAVVVSAIGLMSSSFPGSKAASSAVIAITGLLVVGAVATSITSG